MTKLILIRHGETDYSVAHKYCGFSNPALNKNGVKQARALHKRLKNIGVDKVYSSDLKRARETSRIVFKGRRSELLAGLREINFGVFEGLPCTEIVKRFPAPYRRWVNDPVKIKIPEGEALKAFVRRVKNAIMPLLRRHKGKTIAVVTHNGPIRACICDFFKIKLKDFWEIMQELGAVTIIDFPEDSAPVAITVNDVSHMPAGLRRKDVKRDYFIEEN